MNKIEKIHKDNTTLTAPYALLSTKGGFEPVTSVIAAAEITEKIAIEFFKWMRENDTQDNAEKYFNFTDKDMFEEFLKTKQ